MSKEAAMAHEATEEYVSSFNPDKIFDNHLYATTEAAKLLGLSPAALKKWVYQGRIPVKRIGLRKFFFLGSDLKAMVSDVGLYREEAGKLRKQE